ncbi:dTDP-4-dehydrorhamnose 3,5-epimerase family protein [Streptomyces sp. C10-9-1]|uniref:dTDP-4-dehydrorhamnose 3,5-epimerase family protein n=1 Tax=Streptomyces sp. C10-9-1 TaxID=1859285 RepID=UPI002112A2D7|nr:dTDP-4-dehydrorhamnose 3,5-epimerase family protein [Streptomyces sp. C10-9-1]MCQ6552246.1 dTDP-4-dehydrorhamnose 3,5-epimerase family protein [Streptomyces sp. C10-9-1]
MESRELAVGGAWVFRPTVYPDDRGLFVSPYQEAAFAKALGHGLFPVAQTNHSRSRRGVIRGVHYTTTPPGTAKYVYCARGRTVDFVVDLRVGSPTFGRWDSVLLDQRTFQAVYLPVGVGHAFVALSDDTVVSYLLSGAYDPAHEQSVSVLDPEIGLEFPDGLDPVLSERDRAAVSLAEARATGALPVYRDCLRVEETLFGPAGLRPRR